MKFLIDFFPIAIFFIAFKVFDIYVATAVAIGATLLQIAYLKRFHGRVEVMQWVSLGVIVVFGGATLIFHDNTFIKWKPTVLYWLMASSLLIGQLIFKRNLMKSFMGEQLTLPEHAWGVLLISWVSFLSTMGVINLYVAYNYDLDTWVNFKLFGSMGLMVVFAILQGIYLARFVNDEKSEDPQVLEDPAHINTSTTANTTER
jgi:intracellular septation protein